MTSCSALGVLIFAIHWHTLDKMSTGHLYFHAPCFDGAASAALAQEYLEQHWGCKEFALHGVNYHLKNSWLATDLGEPCAVVDFLYHPKAAFWADHHPTTFVDAQVEQDFNRRAKNDDFLYDAASPSCMNVLWNRLGANTSEVSRARYKELTRWADRIDAALYDSVEEALECPFPALKINMALNGASEGFCIRLVSLLRCTSLEEIVEMEMVRSNYERISQLSRAGLERLKESVKLEEGDIATFDVDTEGIIVNRYAPYYFFSKARYSLGVMRDRRGARIVAMRNPWMEFPSVPLGEIFSSFGGGGHQRVGSLVLGANTKERVEDITKGVLEKIRTLDRQSVAGKSK